MFCSYTNFTSPIKPVVNFMNFVQLQIMTLKSCIITIWLEYNSILIIYTTAFYKIGHCGKSYIGSTTVSYDSKVILHGIF